MIDLNDGDSLVPVDRYVPPPPPKRVTVTVQLTRTPVVTSSIDPVVCAKYPHGADPSEGFAARRTYEPFEACAASGTLLTATPTYQRGRKKNRDVVYALVPGRDADSGDRTWECRRVAECYDLHVSSRNIEFVGDDAGATRPAFLRDARSSAAAMASSADAEKRRRVEPASPQPAAHSGPPAVPTDIAAVCESAAQKHRGCAVPLRDVLGETIKALRDFAHYSAADVATKKEWFRVCRTGITAQLSAAGCVVGKDSVQFA
jgi:hypothetical protein